MIIQPVQLYQFVLMYLRELLMEMFTGLFQDFLVLKMILIYILPKRNSKKK